MQVRREESVCFYLFLLAIMFYFCYYGNWNSFWGALRLIELFNKQYLEWSSRTVSWVLRGRQAEHPSSFLKEGDEDKSLSYKLNHGRWRNTRVSGEERLRVLSHRSKPEGIQSQALCPFQKVYQNPWLEIEIGQLIKKRRVPLRMKVR